MNNLRFNFRSCKVIYMHYINYKYYVRLMNESVLRSKNMKNKINKERRRSMNATPIWPKTDSK
jgi:hypothetical protein